MNIRVNESMVERFARIIIGGILLLLITYLAMPAVLFWSFLVIGLFLILTGLSGYCLIYDLLKIVK